MGPEEENMLAERGKIKWIYLVFESWEIQSQSGFSKE